MGIPSDRRFLAVAAKRLCHLFPRLPAQPGYFWTCKDILTLERHGARTLAGLRERVLQRFLCLAACITINHELGRPSRALVDYCA